MEETYKEKVLIIDDDLDICETLCNILELEGYSPKTVSTGAEAIEVLSHNSFGIALIDMNLPDYHGVDLLKELQKKNPAMLCAIITGDTEVDSVVASLREGAFGYFTKPFPIEKLLHDIQEALDKRNLEARLKLSQAQVIQQEKMASIGQLSAGVAHEINNPVGFVNSNLSTLRKYFARLTEFLNSQEAIVKRQASGTIAEEVAKLRKELKIDYILEDVDSLITESLEGTERIRKIVQDLKLFSRQDPDEAGLFNINEAIESSLNIVWNELKYTTTVKKDLGELPPILCFPQKLSQVFVNILINAGQAIERKGEIKIRSWHENDLIHVIISDTGSGMAKEVMDNIFEPFYTTKPPGKGTGLGMSIAAEIIRKHAGKIEVESEVGKGTTFKITIPVTSD